MLGEMDNDFDDAIGALDVVTRKTKELVKKSGACDRRGMSSALGPAVH